MSRISVRFDAHTQQLTHILRKNVFESKQPTTAFSTGCLGSNFIYKTVVNRTARHQLESNQCQGKEICTHVFRDALQTLGRTIPKRICRGHFFLVFLKVQNFNLR